uniref:Uncharacterized protein n=1 Tax=Acrobeloides nanus TaxID=290746 RepID=A0A914CHA7_9BILA
MFDGFDEISPDYRETAIHLIQALRNSTIKQIWVTTRPNERDILEDELQQLSYKLEPFSKDNQVDFLTKFWQQKPGLSEVTQAQQERLKDYAEALIGLLTKWIRYKDTELTGGYLDVVQWLVEHGADVNVKSNNGETVLHSAAQWGSLAVVQWLVEHGADVNVKSNDGRTVLHSAAQGSLDVVQWLVEHGADVNVKSNDGRTVLHSAAQGSLDVVQWLVEHGADVNATDIDGKTPLNLAKERKYKNITEYLKKRESVWQVSTESAAMADVTGPEDFADLL